MTCCHIFVGGNRAPDGTQQFDYWLVHPPNIFFRMIIEDLGIAWFWPHIVAGVYLLYTHLSVSQFIVGISCSLLAAIMEMCWILCFYGRSNSPG
jgi:hypothetical protein